MQAQQGCLQLIGSRRIDQDSVVAVVYDFGYATDSARDDRQALLHRVEQYAADTLFIGWQNEHIERR